MGLFNRYIDSLDQVNTHSYSTFHDILDTELRLCIGKTNDIRVPLCSHQAIISRELDETHCRVCNKKFLNGVGHWNDYLILRHPACLKAICSDCAEKKPDAFYLAFKRGLAKFKSIKAIDKAIDAWESGIKV